MLRPNDSLGLLTVDIPTCICVDAFLLARASLQIRLQPRAVVASRLLVFPRCKAKKRKEPKRGGMRGNITRMGSKEGPVPIERGGFEKRGKRRGCALTNRMAKETRRFYRRSDRIYEYGHHQSFVSRKRDTRGVRLVSLCD